MTEHFAVRGRSEEDQLWRTFIVLKATDRTEAVELLDQWLKSHQKGQEYIAFKVDDIRQWEFGNFSRQEGCRGFVSKTAQEAIAKERKEKAATKKAGETKQQMLIGAP